MPETKPVLMQGNEACAEGAISAGVRFYAGYPITPSTEIAEHLAVKLPEIGGVFIQMEDEIASMAAVIGASVGGMRSLTATSGPGFSLKQENLGYAIMAEIPCVVVNVQRMGPSTGVPTAPSQGDVMQARWGTHGDHPIIVLSPASVYETFYLTIAAVNLSQKLRQPVILLLDEVIGHMREKVLIPEAGKLLVEKTSDMVFPDWKPYDDKGLTPLVPFGSGHYYHVTGLFHDQYGFPTEEPPQVERTLNRLQDKMEKYRDEIILTSYIGHKDPRVAIVAYGCTVRSARAVIKRAYWQNRWPVGLLSLQTIWPFPTKEIEALARQVDVIIVPEMNMGQLVGEVERYARGQAQVVPVNRYDGEMINPDQIFDQLGRWLT
ncbi:MAG TPA: 2-oxoacid:acceptor oxidoreductase subunit alpha [Candidatus Limnocylindrales bacterium]|nr:2-oxoacid:acceptor oxidoreductase subunit alpha [Candidatus Limnocylindrales bacterium]